jgi:predicted Zn finger-like uncharacterized protein
MPTAIHCPHCRRMLKLHDADVGKTVRCPSCAQVFAARLDDDVTLSPSAVPDFELSSSEPPPRHAVQPKPPPPEDRERGRLRPQVDAGDVYAVQLDDEATAPPHEEERRRRRRVSHWDEYEPDVEPHRGTLILVLGVLSLVLACIPLAGWILGGISMTMGANDCRLMDQRVMDRSGRSLTRAGQVCGILGVFLATIMFIINMALYVNHHPLR